jgi:hypothetical protein
VRILRHLRLTLFTYPLVRAHGFGTIVAIDPVHVLQVNLDLSGATNLARQATRGFSLQQLTHLLSRCCLSKALDFTG